MQGIVSPVIREKMQMKNKIVRLMAWMSSYTLSSKGYFTEFIDFILQVIASN
jgi:hypothetical protein